MAAAVDGVVPTLASKYTINNIHFIAYHMIAK